MWSYLKKRHEGDNVGLLLQSLYGTRVASANFQEGGQKGVDQGGFSRGKNNPGTYNQEKVGVKAMVHRDDSLSPGSSESLRWF